jgi:hypothetical protein
MKIIGGKGGFFKAHEYPSQREVLRKKERFEEKTRD